MRRLFVVMSLMLALVGCGSRSDITGGDRGPNVLLLLVDDLRWDAMSATGHPPLATPHLDRLVHEGTLFPDAFVQISLCSPSRASMFSGLRPDQHGITGIGQMLSDDVPLVSEALQAAGYETAYVGKWHLNFDGQPARGFDRWVSFTTAATYFDPEIVREWSVAKMPGHMTDILTEHALFFLRQRSEKPFFLTLSHLAAHEPYRPQPRFDALLDSVEVSLPETADRIYPGQPSWLRCHAQARVEWAEVIRGYHELLAGVDESVGKVLAELESQDILDETLILLIGDNGVYLGEHGMGDKRSAYEESMRVPIVVRYPRSFPAGSRAEGSLALNLDVAPTVLKAAGLPVPEAMAGLPLQDLRERPSVRSHFGFCYFQPTPPKGLEVCTPDVRAVRTHRHKLITYPGTDELPELYDLELDPHETHNVFASPEYRAVADTLERLLESTPWPER